MGSARQAVHLHAPSTHQSSVERQIPRCVSVPKILHNFHVMYVSPFPANGEYFATGSYDNSAKVRVHVLSCLHKTTHYPLLSQIWTAPDCLPLKTLSTQSKVMYVDIAPGINQSIQLSTTLPLISFTQPLTDGRTVATASYDNTFKLWSPEV